MPWLHVAENSGGAAKGRGNRGATWVPSVSLDDVQHPDPAVDPRGDLHSGDAPAGSRLFASSDWQSGNTAGGTPIGTPLSVPA